MLCWHGVFACLGQHGCCLQGGYDALAGRYEGVLLTGVLLQACQLLHETRQLLLELRIAC